MPCREGSRGCRPSGTQSPHSVFGAPPRQGKKTSRPCQVAPDMPMNPPLKPMNPPFIPINPPPFIHMTPPSFMPTEPPPFNF